MEFVFHTGAFHFPLAVDLGAYGSASISCPRDGCKKHSRDRPNVKSSLRQEAQILARGQWGDRGQASIRRTAAVVQSPLPGTGLPGKRFAAYLKEIETLQATKRQNKWEQYSPR